MIDSGFGNPWIAIEVIGKRLTEGSIKGSKEFGRGKNADLTATPRLHPPPRTKSPFLKRVSRTLQLSHLFLKDFDGVSV